MVPARAIAEILLVEVEFLSSTMEIVLVGNNGRTVVLQVGSTVMNVNGTNVYIPQAPLVVYGRALVPLHSVVEAFGGTVVWNESTQTETITT